MEPDNIIIDDDSQLSLIAQVLDVANKLQDSYTPNTDTIYIDGLIGETTKTHLGMYKKVLGYEEDTFYEILEYNIKYTQTIDSGVTILLKEMVYDNFETANNMYQRLKEKVI